MRLLRRLATAKIDREEARAEEIRKLLLPAAEGEVVVAPWGERVTLLRNGETAHELPLTLERMRRLRSAFAGDGDLRSRLLRRLLPAE